MTITRTDEYGAVAGDFFRQEQPVLYNTIVSGGRQSDRSAVEMSMIELARTAAKQNRQQMPVVIIHCGNPHLKQRYCREGKNIRLPEVGYTQFEPLEGLTDQEIAGRLYAAASQNSTVLGAGFRDAVIKGCELLHLQGEKPGILTLSALPWGRLPVYVEQLLKQGRVEREEAMLLLAELGELSAELRQAAAFLQQLREEYEPLAVQGAPAAGLDTVIRKNGIACIELASGMTAMRELVFYTLKRLTLQRKRFLLVADAFPIPQDKSYVRDVLCSGSEDYSVVMAYADMPAALRDSFNSFAGGNTNVILFAHQSGASAEIWADYIGKRYQLVENTSASDSRSKTDFLSGQVTRSRNREEQLRHVIPAEEIQHLGRGEALVQAGDSGSGVWFVDFPKMEQLVQSKTLRLPGW